MKIYKFISTIKAKDPQGKQPTHYLVAKPDQTQDKGEFVASLWAKEYKNQNGEIIKFLSGQMKEQWTDHNDSSKNRKGFVIVEEAELDKLLNAYKTLQPSEVNVPTADGMDYPTEDLPESPF